jgi:hypothetical protein
MREEGEGRKGGGRREETIQNHLKSWVDDKPRLREYYPIGYHYLAIVVRTVERSRRRDEKLVFSEALMSPFNPVIGSWFVTKSAYGHY